MPNDMPIMLLPRLGCMTLPPIMPIMPCIICACMAMLCCIICACIATICCIGFIAMFGAEPIGMPYCIGAPKFIIGFAKNDWPRLGA